MDVAENRRLRSDDLALNVDAVLSVYEAAMYAGLMWRTDNPDNAHLVCSLCRRVIAAEAKLSELEGRVKG